jgi:hemolysin activation/secretion protein
VLNVRALEQGVENMQRLPSQIVTTRLEPGSTADTSRVTLQRQVPSMRERVRGGLTLDNSGGRLLGSAQFSGYVSLDNPFNINDIITASVNSNAEHPEEDHRSQSFSLNYSVPYRYSLWTFTQSRNRFAQRVRGTSVLFLSKGENETSELRMAYILFRTASSKYGLFVAVSTRRANGFIEDLELTQSRRRLTYLEQGVSYKKIFRSASVEGSIAMRTGKSWFDAEPEFLDAGNGQPTLRPEVWTARLNYTQPFVWVGRSFQFSTGLQGQHTDDEMLAADQMSIGGRYSVRGFDGEQVLMGENGFTWRNEISSPVRWLENVHTSFFLGGDVGRVWGPSDIRLVGNKLVGMAVGSIYREVRLLRSPVPPGSGPAV